MKYIDLYAGIGGFRKALDNQGHECVFSAEIDSFALQTYKENYNENANFNLDDVQKMSKLEIDKKIPDHEILVGGFPCQPFSIGGNRKGFETEDSKGNQFFNILKILDIKKPNYIFLENVPHLFTHDSKKTWKIISEELKKRNYFLPKQNIILSPEDFGIPQNRKRVFIIGFKNKKPDNFYFEKIENFVEILTDNPENKNFIIKKELSKVFLAWGEFINEVKFPENKTLPVIWIDEMISSDNLNNEWPKWKIKYVQDMRNFYFENKKFINKWIERHDVKNWSRRNKKLEWQAGKNERDIKNSIITLRQSGIRCKAKPIYPTLVAMVQTPIIFDEKYNAFREISPREAARLQSFPDDFILNSTKNQAYKQFGNSVNIKVIEELAKFYFSK